MSVNCTTVANGTRTARRSVALSAVPWADNMDGMDDTDTTGTFYGDIRLRTDRKHGTCLFWVRSLPLPAFVATPYSCVPHTCCRSCRMWPPDSMFQSFTTTSWSNVEMRLLNRLAGGRNVASGTVKNVQGKSVGHSSERANHSMPAGAQQFVGSRRDTRGLATLTVLLEKSATSRHEHVPAPATFARVHGRCS